MKLIIINGLPASGKTTLSQRLAEDLNIPLFSKDSFKELLSDSVGFDTHKDSQILGKASFELLVLIAKELLSKEQSVMIEGNFASGEIMRDFLTWTKEKGIAVYEVLCYADEQVLVERFKNRKRHPVHHTLSEDLLGEYFETKLAKGKDTPLGEGKLLEIDTTFPEKIAYQEIESFLTD